MYGFAQGFAYLSITLTTCNIEMKAWPNLAPTHVRLCCIYTRGGWSHYYMHAALRQSHNT